ncbi:hypothetical protein ACFQMJ_14720 [Cohnella cellulosilytica]|uniref:Uncharacterized protein n=1 Tax=Cohnella cellulosilytica TaxID=986710 RepID=A0ABW2FCX4_9BACL
MTELFRAAASEAAGRLNCEYACEEDGRVTEYLPAVRRKARKGKSGGRA